MPEAIKSAFLTSRPFSWINTSFPFVAGWLTAGTPLGWPFWLGVFFFLVPYNLAMYGINDIYDYESDLQNPPKASIEGALLNPSQFRRLWSVILLLGLPPAAVLPGVGPAASKLLLLFSLFMVVAYSAPPFRFKEKPLLDSFTSSCHFVTPLLYGVLLAGGRLSSIAPTSPPISSGVWPAMPSGRSRTFRLTVKQVSARWQG